jgi:hypothetical protein
MRILLISLLCVLSTSCAVDKAFNNALHSALNSNTNNYNRVAVVSLLGDEFLNYGGGFTSIKPVNEKIDKSDWKIDEYSEKLVISGTISGKYELLKPSKEQRSKLLKTFTAYKNNGDELNLIKTIIPSKYDALLVVMPLHKDNVSGGYGFYSYNMLGIQTGCPYASLSIETYDLNTLSRKVFAPGDSREYCGYKTSLQDTKPFSQYSQEELDDIKSSILAKIQQDILNATKTLNLK